MRSSNTHQQLNQSGVNVNFTDTTATTTTTSSSSRRTSKGDSTTMYEESSLSTTADSKKKRIRKSYSCGNCQARKSKCDRSFPCGQCLVRGVQSTCHPKSTSSSQSKNEKVNIEKEGHSRIKAKAKAAPEESVSSLEESQGSSVVTSSNDSDIALNDENISFDMLHRMMKSLQKQLAKADHKTEKIKFMSPSKSGQMGDRQQVRQYRRSSWATATDTTMELYVTIEGKIRALEYKLDMILNRLAQLDRPYPDANAIMPHQQHQQLPQHQQQQDNVRPVLLRGVSQASQMQSSSSHIHSSSSNINDQQNLHLDLTMNDWLQQVGWPTQMDTDDGQIRSSGANSY